jgi:hypothetical protein
MRNTLNPRRNNLLNRPAELKPSRRWLQESDATRAQNLAVIDAALPWSKLVEMARPFFIADLAKPQGGRPGYGLELMIRSWVLALLYSASHRGLAIEIQESGSMAAFIGSPLARATPGASRLKSFTRLLAETTPPGEVLSLADLMAIRVRDALSTASLAYRAGVIREFVLQRTPPPTPAARDRAEALAAANAETTRHLREMRAESGGECEEEGPEDG